MGRTTKHQQALYLEHDRAQQLDQLAQQTRIPKAVLLREAVDDLLVKHKVLKASDLKRPPPAR
jgi:predicted DNA-binding protein